MSGSETKPFPGTFDDRNVQWRKLGDMDGFVAALLNADREKNSVDFLIKFDPDTRVLFHRHLAPTYTFVIEGDHVIYEPDGTVRESRPVGCYSVAEVTGDVHSEGGGPDGCVLLYSIRGDGDAMFDILDADLQPAGSIGIAAFEQLLS